MSWVLCVALVVVAIITFVGTITSAVPTTTFAGGERATVTLDPANSPALYATGDQTSRFSCQMFSRSPAPPGWEPLVKPTVKQSVSLGGVEWELISHIRVPTPGEYQVTCESERPLRFGVGTNPHLGAVLPTLILLPLLGLTLAVATTIIVLVKRNSARRRP
ncbi:hypothetical protein [Pseudonocardia acaciae]|uniref:hypothetical protein n=1 Tax=Pseudonocardia acaciae TaxID=551276 RepID=UPI00048C2C5A|nr:hypothetical protein [Pseudonocardia acaciae]